MPPSSNTRVAEDKLDERLRAMVEDQHAKMSTLDDAVKTIRQNQESHETDLLRKIARVSADVGQC
jgi:hypothetical protein